MTPPELIETGRQIGTASNQVVLGILVVILIGLVIYLHRLGRVETAKLHEDNRKAVADLIARLDAKDAAMSDERIKRINSLMELIRENIQTNARVANAIENNNALIKSHNDALRELKEFMREQAAITEKHLDLFQKAVGRV